MMPTPREMNAMRSMTSEFRPQVVQVRRPSLTSDGGGGVTAGTPTKFHFITARFNKVSSATEEIFGGATSKRHIQSMATDHDADIRLQDQVLVQFNSDNIITTNTYEVLSIDTPRGFEMEKRAILGSVESGGKF